MKSPPQQASSDSKQRPRVLVAEPSDFSPRAREILDRIADVDLAETPAERLPAAFQSYDVVWLRLAHRIGVEVLGDSPRCRTLACAVTGLDHIDLEACRRRGVRVLSLKGETKFLQEVRATAEHTVALALALLRRIPEAARSVREGIWDRDLFRGGELYGKTAGIVGMGRLGTLVAGYLRAFGMTVLGHDPRPDFPNSAAERVQRLEELLARSDLVSLHVSYDASTRHLIGERQLAAMRPEAVLINTARGGVIDEAALLAALDSGRLGGAALDVLDGEPHIDASHLLVQAASRLEGKLLIVPHVGGNTFESIEKTETFIAEKIVRALEESP